MSDPIVARLLEIRAREGISTAAMAARVGVKRSALHLVFRGERGVGRRLLEAAISAYPELRELYTEMLATAGAGEVA